MIRIIVGSILVSLAFLFFYEFFKTKHLNKPEKRYIKTKEGLELSIR